MERDEIIITPTGFRELVRQSSNADAVTTRAAELTEVLADSGSALTAHRGQLAEIQRLYARRLRTQQKTNRTVTAGLLDLVTELNNARTPYVWVAYYELGPSAGHIFITRDPDKLVGITTAPRRDAR